MSYFDSLLASVGVDGDPTTNPAPSGQLPKPSSRPMNIPPHATTNAGTTMKRKADVELATSVKKTLKISNTTQGAVANPTSNPATVRSAASLVKKAPPGSELSSSTKKITSKDAVPSKPNIGAKPMASKPPMSANQPAPGSLAELLARAKNMQSTKLGQVGGFTNKSTTKSKEEAKENRKKLLEARKPKGSLAKAKAVSRSGSEGPMAQKKVAGAKKPVVEPKPKRKPIEIAYKGTMRGPTQPTYKGTANPKSTRDDQTEDRSRYGNDRYRRDYSDSVEEDENENGFGSEASSDMEAGAWDIDEEEELALRTARKEDAREQKLEEELKRKKLLRKQGFGI